MSDKSDTPRTDALQEELASMNGPEGLYTEEMADRMWFLMAELEGKLTFLYANCIGDSMALGIMQLQRNELAQARAEREDCRVAAHAAMLQRNQEQARAEKAEAENKALREVIYWALGERDAFPDRPERWDEMKFKPWYWWRTELRSRLAAIDQGGEMIDLCPEGYSRDVFANPSAKGWTASCPNMKPRKGDTDMEADHYECACGRTVTLYHDEMR